MSFYWLILGLLGVWRITHLLYVEDGPWNILVRLRRAAGTTFWGGLLDCFYCLSIWVALPFAWVLGENWKHRLLLWPALSGGAILLQQLTSKEELQPNISYSEDTEESYRVLRAEQSTVADSDTKTILE